MKCEYRNCKRLGEKIQGGTSVIGFLCVKHLKRVEQDFNIKWRVRA